MDEETTLGRADRHRLAQLVVGGVLALVVCFVAVPSAPAGAWGFHRTVSITFKIDTGESVTCDFNMSDTESPGESFASQLSTDHGSTGTSPPCLGTHTLIVTYRDSAGTELVAQVQGHDRATESLRLGGVDTLTRVDHTIFFDKCEPEVSDACFITRTVGPK